MRSDKIGLLFQVGCPIYPLFYLKQNERESLCNDTIIDDRPTHGTLRKRHQTETNNDKLIKARIHYGFDVRKPVFGVSEKARLKPVSLATETS